MPSRNEVDELCTALAMPPTIVRLSVPLKEIARRLGDSVTAGRQDDLRVAREWIAARRGDDIGDLVVENDHPIREVALRLLTMLGWGEGVSSGP